MLKMLKLSTLALLALGTMSLAAGAETALEKGHDASAGAPKTEAASAGHKLRHKLKLASVTEGTVSGIDASSEDVGDDNGSDDSVADDNGSDDSADDTGSESESEDGSED